LNIASRRNEMKTQYRQILITATVALALTAILTVLTACEKSGQSYSLESAGTGFRQATNYVPRPIDILWVIDNSGSMESSQNNLAANFSSFINRFVGQNYDFHMAVTTTEAWRGKYTANNPDFRKFMNGGWVCGLTPPAKCTQSNQYVFRSSSVFMMDKNSANMTDTNTNNDSIQQIFDINARLGIFGSGDERAFESLKDTLTWTGNDVFAFRRPNAYFAVIIVSDEDDFSATTSTYLNNNYNSANLIPVNNYVSWLDTYAGVIANQDPAKVAADRKTKYSVNTISIQDNTCLAQLNDSTQRLGLRYKDIATKTGGLNLSLCGDFASNLNLISSTVEAAISEIQLTREPVVSSIVVTVNGVKLAQDATNGWSYDSTTMILKFNGSGIPPAGADVQIIYDPVTVAQ